MADDLNRDGLENQIKGVGKEAEGKIRNSVGGLTGDTSEQIKGKAEELKGKAVGISRFGTSIDTAARMERDPDVEELRARIPPSSTVARA